MSGPKQDTKKTHLEIGMKDRNTKDRKNEPKERRPTWVHRHFLVPNPD
jgi:hypothetical protein